MTHARYPEWQADAAETLIAPIVAIEPGPVLLCLQAVQAHFGYVPGDAVAMIAEACNVSRGDTHGVFTFYADLRNTLPPAVPVRLCAAEACGVPASRCSSPTLLAPCLLSCERAAAVHLLICTRREYARYKERSERACCVSEAS